MHMPEKRRPEIAQKKAHNIQNTAKAWNQGHVLGPANFFSQTVPFVG